jgi:hypothetical protein
MELDLEDEELSALEYARRYGLCKAYDSEKPETGSLYSLIDDTFDQDPWDSFDESVTNAVRGLTRERLAVNKDAILFLKAVRELTDVPAQDLLMTDRWKGKLGLKLELPLLRTDNELDLMNFGSAAIPDFGTLNIPTEIVKEENDEGLQWPAKYFAYPAQCDERVKGEKLAVSKEVLVHLRDTIQEPYTPKDYEMIMVQSQKYKPVSAKISDGRSP